MHIQVPTEKHAFCMFLRPNMADEYRRRHDEIWPELVQLLKQAGVQDYSIYLDEPRHVLFAVLRRRADHAMDSLASQPVMQRWWQHMKDLMHCHPDGSPVVQDLPCMFHLD